MSGTELMARACASKSWDACHHLGRLYSTGLEGVRIDYPRAQAFYKQACDNGNHAACTSLGELIDQGKGGPKDPESAARLYESACSKVEAKSCSRLGLLYSEGVGVDRNFIRSAQLYRQACDRDDGMGCNGLGVRYSRGEGVMQDTDRADSLYAKACSLWNALGCLNMGRVKLYGRDSGGVNTAAAAEYFKRACQLDESEGCTLLAEAVMRAERDCDKGDCVNYGYMQEHGLGLPKDVSRAVKSYQRSCDEGHPIGCQNLAWLYKNGSAVTLDLPRSRALFKRGCSLAHSPSCEQVRLQGIR